jgi:hypothetical protein
MFFELREYTTMPGQRDNWVKFMENIIIPFQVSKGMVILGSFVGQEQDDLYVWIRRFENEDEKTRLYESVYGSDIWKNEIGQKIPEMMDRSKIVVRNIQASSRSVIQ